MTLKNQFQKLKDHWLVILVIAILVIVLNNGSFLPNTLTDKIGYPETDYAIGGVPGRAVSDSYYPYDEGFAPGVEDRKITRNIYSSIEVNRGEIDNSIQKLKQKITNHGGIILNENKNKYGDNLNERKSASYNIKVPESEYKSFVNSLSDLGEIESYSENAIDVTERYLDTEDQLKLEKDRLTRYESLLSQSNSVEEKISITDRIFNQERTIKYLEESLSNQGLRIEYVTANINLNEEESNFAGTLFVSLKELIRTFVSSLNSLITTLIYLLPWIILIWIIRFFWKK